MGQGAQVDSSHSTSFLRYVDDYGTTYPQQLVDASVGERISLQENKDSVAGQQKAAMC